MCKSSCRRLLSSQHSSAARIASRQQFVDATAAKGPRCTWAREFTDADTAVLMKARLAQAQFQVAEADAAVEAAHADWKAAESTGTSESGSDRMQVQAGPDPFGNPHTNRVLVHLPTAAAASASSGGAGSGSGDSGGAAPRAVWLTPQEAADSRNSLPRGARRGLWDILNPQVLNSLRAGGSDVDCLRVDMWRQLSAVRQREEFLAQAKRRAAAARARLDGLAVSHCAGGASSSPSSGSGSSSGGGAASSSSSSGARASPSSSAGGSGSKLRAHSSGGDCIDLSEPEAESDSDNPELQSSSSRVAARCSWEGRPRCCACGGSGLQAVAARC